MPKPKKADPLALVAQDIANLFDRLDKLERRLIDNAEQSAPTPVRKWPMSDGEKASWKVFTETVKPAASREATEALNFIWTAYQGCAFSHVVIRREDMPTLTKVRHWGDIDNLVKSFVTGYCLTYENSGDWYVFYKTPPGA